MTITLNKEKNIGKVLFVVEGLKTEFFLLRKIFTQILDYEYKELDRIDKYRRYNDKEGIESSIFVINSEESAIKFVSNDNEFLNNLFRRLIDEYQFPVDRAAIYYLFDRDVKSNTDREYIAKLIRDLSHSRDNNGFSRQGLLLLSYPAVESFIVSNFIDDTVHLEVEKGGEVKALLHQMKLNQSRIDERSLTKAVEEMEKAFLQIGVSHYDLDDFAPTNLDVFHHQEQHYDQHATYKLMSLLSIIFLDLGIIEIEGV